MWHWRFGYWQFSFASKEKIQFKNILQYKTAILKCTTISNFNCIFDQIKAALVRIKETYFENSKKSVCKPQTFEQLGIVNQYFLTIKKHE